MLNITGIFKAPYLKINLVFSVIILFVFAYSLSFSAHKQNHPLPSFYSKISGKESISSGLSKSFSEVIRGNLKKAKEHNIYGPRIFMFFLAQFFFRIIFSFLYGGNLVSRLSVTISDSVISVILFIICFWPFILNLVQTI